MTATANQQRTSSSIDPINVDGVDYAWGVNGGHKAHLFPQGERCVYSLCGSAYSGDNWGVSAKRKRCKICERKLAGHAGG